MLKNVFYTSVLVSDQDRALDFYTNVLGLEKRVENPTPDGPRFLTVGVAGDDFQLVLQDNGRGIPLELDGKLDRGHGMSTMKQRAKQLHGQCLVESGPGYGTVIRLTLPL